VRLTARWTPAEIALITRAAKRLRMSRSELVRETVLARAREVLQVKG
jgi:uncharacterized protein (DUF1778 family)